MYRRFSESAPHCQITSAGPAASFSWHVESLDARPGKTVCIRENHENIRRQSFNDYGTIKLAAPILHRIVPWDRQNWSRKMTDNNAILEMEASVMVLAALYALALIGLIVWLA